MSEPAVEGEIIDTKAVVPSEPASAPIVRADARDVVAAFGDYQKIQAALDQAMPDCIMTIQGRSFRKKSYWRAIATAFNLTVEPVGERREDVAGDDWGYCITYRATANNGRSAIGDGACFASEKWSDRPVCPVCGESEFAYRSKKEGGESHFCWRSKGGCGTEWTPAADADVAIDKSASTVHNVRSHAHTRAFNRAVSNLVGFGEVSAEEMQYDGGGRAEPPPQPPPAPPAQAPPAAPSRPAGLDEAEYETYRQESETAHPPAQDWMQEKVGFGKHKDRTWSEMAGGSRDGEAHGYLKWVLRNIDDKPEFLNKAKATLAALEERVEREDAAKGDDEITF